jgi:hypothetical protein
MGSIFRLANNELADEKKTCNFRKSNKKHRTKIAAMQEASSCLSEENRIQWDEFAAARDTRTKLEKAQEQEIASKSPTEYTANGLATLEFRCNFSH